MLIINMSIRSVTPGKALQCRRPVIDKEVFITNGHLIELLTDHHYSACLSIITIIFIGHSLTLSRKVM